MMRSLLLLPLVALAGAPAHAQLVRVELRNAGPDQVARELSRALAAPVDMRGGRGRTVSLTLATTSPALTLDRVAAQLGGTWKMELRVRLGQAGGGPAVRPLLERRLAVGMQDLPAERAFGLVARELKAELQVEGATDRRVTLAPMPRSALVLLDSVSEQAGASWSIRYVLQTPDAPPPPEPEERDLVLPPPRVAPPPPAPARPAAPRVPMVSLVAPTGTALRQALWADVNQLLRADPGQRAQAVSEFIATGRQRIAALAGLSPAARAGRLATARSVLIRWRRIYQGLAPGVRKELAPAAKFLESVWS